MRSPASKKDVQSNWPLWITVCFALALRLWGVWNVSTSDEYNEVFEALRVCSGHFNLERWIKRFYLYILAVEYSLYYIGGWIFQAFSNPLDFAEKIVRNMEPLFVMGRVTSAIAGTVTVGVVYQIGVRFFKHWTAVIASLLMTLTVFHIDLSQQAKVDALLGLLVVGTFYFMLEILAGEKINKWDCARCGFFLALAIQTKVNAIVLFFPFFLVIIWRFKEIREGFYKPLLFFTSFFVLGFILGNPPVLIAPLKFFRSIPGLGNVYTTPVNVVPNELLGFVAYPLYYYRAMGSVISGFTILSLVYVFYRPNKQKAILLCFIMSFYFLMGSTKNLVAPYYLIPIVPFIYLLIGDFLADILNRTIQGGYYSNSIKSLSIGFVGIVALATPVGNVIFHELSLTGENTRYLAKDWIEKNMPTGSKILMDSGKSINSFAPPIAENKNSLERIINNARENLKKGKIVHGMVDQNALVYYELLLRTIPEKSYDITSTMFGLDVKPVDYYVRNNYEYFIISQEMKTNRTNSAVQKYYPNVAHFYSSLDSDPRLKLVKIIRQTSINRGDTFYIYRLLNHSS